MYYLLQHDIGVVDHQEVTIIDRFTACGADLRDPRAAVPYLLPC